MCSATCEILYLKSLGKKNDTEILPNVQFEVNLWLPNQMQYPRNYEAKRVLERLATFL